MLTLEQYKALKAQLEEGDDRRFILFSVDIRDYGESVELFDSGQMTITQTVDKFPKQEETIFQLEQGATI